MSQESDYPNWSSGQQASGQPTEDTSQAKNPKHPESPHLDSLQGIYLWCTRFGLLQYRPKMTLWNFHKHQWTTIRIE